LFVAQSDQKVEEEASEYATVSLNIDVTVSLSPREIESKKKKKLGSLKSFFDSRNHYYRTETKTNVGGIK
jgi:hypothetical protein